MPTYDYRCERCQGQFELWQSFSDDSLEVCPTTGGPAICQAPGEGPVKKIFSKVGIAFKGDGFYKNDHGANAKARAGTDNGKDKAKKDASSETSKDSSSKSDSSSGAKSDSSGSKSSTSDSGSKSVSSSPAND